MSDEVSRSRQARAAAEQALVRVVHHYGARPEFVVLGGLVPELLCSGSSFQHAGTTDVDVQVNLEIACGAVNTARLEHALLNAEFQPDSDNIWRWRTDGSEGRAVVKFELLADLDSAAAETTVKFEECDRLGAANLRGTGYATRDVEVRTLTARVSGDTRTVEVNVTGLAGFLLAKCAAARSRRQPKDWYDIAFVLQHNDIGGPEAAARAVLEKFGAETRAFRSGLDDLLANFADRNAQGPQAYAVQMLIDHPELERKTLLADAVVSVQAFFDEIVSRS
ncbi:MAG: nucleotidyl transferase AbiEii/AbiGii toxin family protein [Woeseia sp.]